VAEINLYLILEEELYSMKLFILNGMQTNTTTIGPHQNLSNEINLEYWRIAYSLGYHNGHNQVGVNQPKFIFSDNFVNN